MGYAKIQEMDDPGVTREQIGSNGKQQVNQTFVCLFVCFSPFGTVLYAIINDRLIVMKFFQNVGWMMPIYTTVSA